MLLYQLPTDLKINEYGVPILVILWILKLLFDFLQKIYPKNQSGITPDQLKIQEMSLTQTRILELVKDNFKVSTRLLEMHKDPNSMFATFGFEKRLVEVESTLQHLEEMNKKVKEELATLNGILKV